MAQPRLVPERTLITVPMAVHAERELVRRQCDPGLCRMEDIQMSLQVGERMSESACSASI